MENLYFNPIIGNSSNGTTIPKWLWHRLINFTSRRPIQILGGEIIQNVNHMTEYCRHRLIINIKIDTQGCVTGICFDFVKKQTQLVFWCQFVAIVEFSLKTNHKKFKLGQVDSHISFALNVWTQSFCSIGSHFWFFSLGSFSFVVTSWYIIN